ncbi:hypothetical protein TIFTF001_011606 [Ficus carica]|uniref:Uncharacterized protein n=1 Tax=Ficus carica TaxID=3494 RepID=A0AA88A070_FICCA|nr:hypothetical protein TIFTF001_011606 [Ficus carica]
MAGREAGGELPASGGGSPASVAGGEKIADDGEEFGSAPDLFGSCNGRISLTAEDLRRVGPAGEPPSPRAAHAVAAVGTMVVFQGGIGPAGILRMIFTVVVQGQGPGHRYGRVMDFVAQRYIVTVSGNDESFLIKIFAPQYILQPHLQSLIHQRH